MLEDLYKDWSKDLSEAPSPMSKKATRILLVVVVFLVLAMVALDQYDGRSTLHTAMDVAPALTMLLLALAFRLKSNRDRRLNRPLPPPTGITRGDAIICAILILVLMVSAGALVIIARLTPPLMWLLFFAAVSFGLTVLWLRLRIAKNRRERA